MEAKYIHLAGTNAKGSTAQYIAEILSVNHKVGMFTSPHIFVPEERFKIDGRVISSYDYQMYMEQERVDPTEHYFGVWTRVALRWFADNAVEYAVIETGLGGRKDQTNVVESDIQIITPISLDHTEFLGDTLQKIAREKCGIIKWGSTVISHPQQKEAMDEIKKTCERLSCNLHILDLTRIHIKSADTSGQVFDFRYEDLLLQDVKLQAIAGAQVQNACVAAICAYELGVPAADIATGIANTHIIAREELYGNVLVDAAHNEASIRELAETVKRYFPKKNITVLTAVMEDKDVATIAAEIENFADTIICTRADRKRGLEAKEYARYFQLAQPMENPSYAFRYARELVDKKRGILVVCGSFYLVPFVLEELRTSAE